jgi:hypothetical protein
MAKQRVSLYDRLPEIYRIRDQEQDPPGQLQAYLSLVEDAFGEIHKNIESLYHDLFIDTCDEWVIPYIGDLLGVTPLKGEAWTQRADVADTIALRRRKGTLASIERLTYNLTQWGVHCVELLENLVWNQHLNHQRPDVGGDPPYGLTREGRPRMTRFTPIRGGTVTLRDPAMLSLLNTPFDPFAHVADVKPPAWGNIRYNLPNLAIFLWRLEDYRVQATQPVWRETTELVTSSSGEATHLVKFDIHPLGRPVRLFNTYPFDPDRQPPIVTELDETPGPIPMARLTQGSEAGRPEKYLSIDTYEPGDAAIATRALTDVGLQLHLPNLSGISWPAWTFRGANLCAWESGLPSTIKIGEIVIDPVIGRLLFGVDSQAAADALQTHLLVTYTYGAVGPVGAHPISRDKAPEQWHGETVNKREVNFHSNPNGLQDSLNDIHESSSPIVIEIQDSMTHTLDLGVISGISNELGVPSLQLNRSLIIRAASNQRPIIQLDQPLRFRPTHVAGTTPEEQNQFNAVMDHLTVRLEGLFITRSADFPVGEPLIARAALNKLEILNCTLDPGGYQQLDDNRAESYPALQLHEPYGFEGDAEENAFDQTPEIVIQHTITGPLRIDRGYTLFLQDSIIDAGEDAAIEFAVAGTDDPTDDLVVGCGPPTRVNGITVFGRMRVESLQGRGGIWVHPLEVLNNQRGCIKFSYFSGQGDRLPQHHACVKGTDAPLHFNSDLFEHPAYGQLAHTTDFRIRERGPRDDAMGAFGFLLEAHKWRNLQIRYREFMPVGIRPLLIPVT